MILENGVFRTMDSSLPVARALAIAGERIAGGVGTHESALPTPEVVDIGGRCVVPGLHGLARPLPHLVAGSARCEPGRSRVAGRGARPGASCNSAGRLDPRPGLAVCGLGDAAHERGARRDHRRDTGRAVGEGPPLAVAELGRACPRTRGSRGRRRRRGARRGGRADRSAAGRGGVAVPRAVPVRVRGRMARGDARGCEARS